MSSPARQRAFSILNRLCSAPHGAAAPTDRLREQRAPLPLVGLAAPDRRGPGLFRRLHHVGGAAGHALRLRQLPLAVLLSASLWRRSARLVRPQAGLVAGLADLHPGPAHSLGARRVPTHLLLLPRRLLQRLLGRPAILPGGR